MKRNKKRYERLKSDLTTLKNVYKPSKEFLRGYCVGKFDEDVFYQIGANFGRYDTIIQDLEDFLANYERCFKIHPQLESRGVKL